MLVNKAFMMLTGYHNIVYKKYHHMKTFCIWHWLYVEISSEEVLLVLKVLILHFNLDDEFVHIDQQFCTLLQTTNLYLGLISSHHWVPCPLAEYNQCYHCYYNYSLASPNYPIGYPVPQCSCIIIVRFVLM